MLGLVCKVLKRNSKKKHGIQEGKRRGKGENACEGKWWIVCDAAIYKRDVPLTGCTRKTCGARLREIVTELKKFELQV